MTEKVVWHVVKMHAKKLEMPKLAPHDLRRSCARFCHSAGGELEQIQFLLGHVSVQTTERYLGCKQRFREAVNDHIGIEPIRRIGESNGPGYPALSFRNTDIRSTIPATRGPLEIFDIYFKPCLHSFGWSLAQP